MSARFDTLETAPEAPPPAANSVEEESPNSRRRKTLRAQLDELLASDDLPSPPVASMKRSSPERATSQGPEETKKKEQGDPPVSDTAPRSPGKSRIPESSRKKTPSREVGPGSPKTASPKGSPKSKPRSSTTPSRELTTAEMQAEVDKIYAFHNDEPDSLDFIQPPTNFQGDPQVPATSDKKPETDKPQVVPQHLEDSIIIPLDDEEGIDSVKPPEMGSPKTKAKKRSGKDDVEDGNIRKSKLKASGEDMGSIPDLSFGLRDMSDLPVKEPEIVATRTWVTGTEKEASSVEGAASVAVAETSNSRPSSPSKSKSRSKLPSPTRNYEREAVKSAQKVQQESASTPKKALFKWPDLDQVWQEVQQTKILMEQDIQKSSECFKMLSKKFCEEFGRSREFDLDNIVDVTGSGSPSALETLISKFDEKELLGNCEEDLDDSPSAPSSPTTKSKNSINRETTSLQNSVQRLQDTIRSRQKAASEREILLFKVLTAWSDVGKQWKVHEARSKLLIERAEEGFGGQGSQKDFDFEEVKSKLAASEEKALYYQRELEQSIQQNKGLQDWMSSITKQKDNLEVKVSELTERLVAETESKAHLESTLRAEMEALTQFQSQRLSQETETTIHQNIENYRKQMLSTNSSLLQTTEQQTQKLHGLSIDAYKQTRERIISDVSHGLSEQLNFIRRWQASLNDQERLEQLASTSSFNFSSESSKRSTARSSTSATSKATRSSSSSATTTASSSQSHQSSTTTDQLFSAHATASKQESNMYSSTFTESHPEAPVKPPRQRPTVPPKRKSKLNTDPLPSSPRPMSSSERRASPERQNESPRYYSEASGEPTSSSSPNAPSRPKPRRAGYMAPTASRTVAIEQTKRQRSHQNHPLQFDNTATTTKPSTTKQPTKARTDPSESSAFSDTTPTSSSRRKASSKMAVP